MSPVRPSPGPRSAPSASAWSARRPLASGQPLADPPRLVPLPPGTEPTAAIRSSTISVA